MHRDRRFEASAEEQDFDFQIFLQPEVVFEDAGLLSAHDRSIRQITIDLYSSDKVEAMTRARTEFPRLLAVPDMPYADMGAIADERTAGEDL